jgi:hypothetical protein
MLGAIVTIASEKSFVVYALVRRELPLRLQEHEQLRAARRRR